MLQDKQKQLSVKQKSHNLISGILCLFVIVIAGCGVEKYEKRLAKTSRYYEYVDKLNRHLSPTPYSGIGISCRLPKQFIEVKNQSKKPELEDTRQPDYLRTYKLEGLASAYQAKLQVAGNDGKTVEKTGYIYMLTNSYLWKDYKPNTGKPDPMKFNDQFTQRILAELNQNSIVPTAELLPPNEEKEFGNQKEYKVFSIVPKEQFNGVSMEFRYYTFSKDDLQTIALFVYPAKVSGTEKLHISIPLAMHTFTAEKYTFPATGKKPPGGQRPVGGF